MQGPISSNRDRFSPAALAPRLPGAVDQRGAAQPSRSNFMTELAADDG
jgi:hypothetical protein